MASEQGSSSSYDLLAIGRSSIDLYAREVGVPFTEIKTFAAYVGGSPTNISVGAHRLGLRTALLTAVGDDHVGDFVLSFLEREGIAAGFSKRKPGRRTSAFILGIEPPDRFSLVPYRDNCADLELTVEDVLGAPIPESRALLITGSGLSRAPSSDATLAAARRAKACGSKVVLDLDFRPEMWPDALAYRDAMRSVMRLVDVVIGTRDEVRRAVLSGAVDGERASAPDAIIEQTAIERASVENEDAEDRISSGIEAALARGPQALVMKRGADSTLVYLPGGKVVEAATFPVEVLNVLGAGDAFASGFIYGYLKDWDWHRAARMGNACGAMLVTRHGCANFMPYEEEALAFIAQRGGF